MSQRLVVVLLALLLGACAHTPPDEPSDPMEGFNRAVFSFNRSFDRYVARPAARGYVITVPAEIRQGFGNFFRNLTYPTVIVNSFLQGKFVQGSRDTGRFLFNSTVGIAGFVDAASMIGLTPNDEDFGQTLGRWGVGQGWFVMLPFLGPTTNRDLVGYAGNGVTNPMTYTDASYSFPLYGLSAVNTRAELLGIESVLDEQFDAYAFVRGAYLQRRLNLVYDGQVPKDKLYGFDDE